MLLSSPLPGNVDKQHVLPALFDRHLTYRLEEGLALDIADGAADLADENVDILVLHGVDAAFYLVGDVGYYLHRAAEVAALPLAVEDVPEYPARRDRGVAAQALVNKALIVTEIEVGLGAVVGDEHLAVLIRAHGAGVDVEVGVKFLVLHAQAALLEQPAQGRRAYALAEPGHNAPRHKYILHIFPFVATFCVIVIAVARPVRFQ